MSALALPGSARRTHWITAAITAGAVGLAVAGSLALAQGVVRVGSPATGALSLVAGLSFVGCGLFAWRRRPEVATGRLMILAGFCVFASSLAESDSSLPFTIGLATSGLPLAVLAHLLLTFPDGRLHSLWERALALAAYVVALVLQVAMLVFMGYRYLDHCPCPTNLLFSSDNFDVHSALMSSQRNLGVAMTMGVVGTLVLRWRQASLPLRRAMGPLAVAGGATIALLGAQLFAAANARPAFNTVGAMQEIAFATVPVAYVFGLFRARLARGAVSDLVVSLREMPQPGQLREVLARALRDPTLDVVYWLPEVQAYVGIDGHPIDPRARDNEAMTEIERHGERVAALIHDPALREEPGLLEAVSAAAGLALENERLLADLRAQLEELRESRARIVEAGDTERRRLERNLHDGAQQRLVSLSLGLGMAADKVGRDPDAAVTLIEGAREELAQALAELRELAEGIHPAILTDRGLAHALERLAERSPVPVDLDIRLDGRPPEPIEAAAYYVVAEGLTNVAKYAQATRAKVRVVQERRLLRVEIADDGVGGADATGGSGLRGLNDRVQAFGGSLTITSPPADGTCIRAELPT